ncbi:MAG: CIA30 family protein [Verrucomicrobiae bacterium]|nr:CIA30 family protein [Verrucomicrobiae bacterium]NNJ42427.1 CIA30 family protein [Akkermansiaceae bacterium]
MNPLLINSLLFLLAANLISQAGEPLNRLTQTLDDFKKTRAAGTWMSVNDGVMGGISRGGAVISKQKNLVFKGEISLENNGGFSSIRTRGEKLDLSAYDGIEVNVKGDGRMYYLTTRSHGRRMLAYWSPIQPPKGEWTVIRVPFDSFYATYFGKKIPALSLNTGKVSSLGVMLYDKKPGAFAIEFESIKVYKE